MRTNITLRLYKIFSGPLLPIATLYSIQQFCRQYKTWSDCANAQGDLGLRCLHMPEDMFSHGAAYLDLEECRFGQGRSLYNTVQLLHLSVNYASSYVLAWRHQNILLNTWELYFIVSLIMRTLDSF